MDVNSQIETEIVSEAQRIEFGKIILEITVNKGKITNLQTTQITKSKNINYV